ncbi:FHA domain-containing protein [Aquisphaera giovannonii]|nr:FHA domain-containing protein [Aquisphaera giovannonii]
MDLPWLAVRIGRSAACEVRLDDPEVPGEACRLQRRGRSWRIIPLGARGSVFVEGTPVAEARPLPFDVPFRVGATCFTLREDRSVEPDWGMYHAPSPRAPAAASVAPEAPPPPEPTPPSPPFAASGVHAYTPAHAHSPPKAPAGPPPATPPGTNPWEARWKAAGARLLADADRPRVPPRPNPQTQPHPREAPDPRPAARAGERARPPAAPPARPARPAEAPARADLRPGFAANPPATPGARRYPEAPRVEHRAEPPARPVPQAPAPARPAAEAAPSPQPIPGSGPEQLFEPAAPLVVAEFDEVADAIAAFASASTGAVAVAPSPQPSPAVGGGGEAACESLSSVGCVERSADAPSAGLVAEEDPVAPGAGLVADEDSATPTASPVAEEVEAAEGDGGGTIEEAGVQCVRAALDAPYKRGDLAASADADAPSPSPLVGEGRGEAAAPATALEVASAPAPAPFEDPWAPVWIMGQPAEFTTETSWPEVAGGAFGEDQLDPVMISPAIAPPRQDARPQVRSATLQGAAQLGRDERHQEPPRASAYRDLDRDGEAEQPRPAAAGGPTTAGRPREHERAPGPGPEADPELLDLPSAKDIMASIGGRAASARGPGDPPVRLARPPQREHVAPTVPLEPAAWSLPAWLAGPPLAILALAVGVPGAWLASRWAADSNNASVIGQRLLAARTGRAKERPLPESVTPPPASWWRTTPLHLAEWGIYRSRPAADEDEREEADELLEGAVRLAPLHPLARLARAEARPAATAEPGGGAVPGMAAHLGLSRDPASLSWSARSLRRAGKNAAAIRLYRRAFQLAVAQGAAGRAMPAFNADPGVHRYYLPGEAAATAIVRELLADADWPCREWIEALPPDGVAALAAARLLHEQGRPEAREVLERILARRDDATPGRPEGPGAAAAGDAGRDREHEGEGDAEDRAPAAVRLAVAAEAHALLERWGDAEAGYRRAIELEGDVTTRRAWWFNLASVASRGGDEDQRKAARTALEAVLEVSSTDEIGRRAVEMQRAAEPVIRSRIGTARAN